MTVDEIKQLVYRVANSVMAGNISPEDFNLFLQRAENNLFEELYSNYEKTRMISDDLTAFKTVKTYMPVVSGAYSYPDDYRHATSFVKYGNTNIESTIEEVQQDKKTGRINSKVIPIDKYPIVVHETAGGFTVYPKTTWVRMYYLKIPVYAYWGYEIISGRPVYDPLTSVQSSFPESLHPEIARRILQYVGIETNRQELLSA